MKYDKAFEHLILNEGGFSDDPLDTGGKTIYGIASAFHPDEFKKIYDLFQAGEKEEALELAKEFYRSNYWNNKYDLVTDSSLAFKLFDLGVNMGVKQAVKLLQETINLRMMDNEKKLVVDGIFGNQSLYYVNRLDKESLYQQFIQTAEKYYRGLKNFDRFGKGWLIRLNKRIYLEG